MARRFAGSLLIIACLVSGAHSSHNGLAVGSNPLTVEEMFTKIWEKYSQGSDTLKLPQFNALLHDTDQEKGYQVVDKEWWGALCEEKGVDPSKGLSKFDFLKFYFEIPGSSIKRDFNRIFLAQLEETEMFDKIWAKYSEHQLMNLHQLNALLRDTDQKHVDEAWWQRLCRVMGTNPIKGITKNTLLTLYSEGPGRSVQRDFIRIFVEGAPVKTPDSHLLQTSAPQMEETEMFDKIWAKYSKHELMNLQQFNVLLHDTDQEQGEQVIDEAWWQSVCVHRGADPSKGITKDVLLRLYFESPPSSIKRDYLRIFVEGSPPQTSQEQMELQQEQDQGHEEEQDQGQVTPPQTIQEHVQLQQEKEHGHEEEQNPGEATPLPMIQEQVKLQQEKGQRQEQQQEQAEATLGFAAHISVGAFVLGSFVVLITEMVRKTLHRKS